MYATVQEFNQLGLPAQASTSIDLTTIERCLRSGSALADSYLAVLGPVPLHAWNDDLRRAVCAIAAWDLLSAVRGFNPEAGADAAVRQRYEDAIDWLERASRGEVRVSAPVATHRAVVLSDARRGW